MVNKIDQREECVHVTGVNTCKTWYNDWIIISCSQSVYVCIDLHTCATVYLEILAVIKFAN